MGDAISMCIEVALIGLSGLKWMEEEHKFKASLGYIMEPCLRKETNNQ